MSLDAITKDNYGYIIKLTFIDVDDDAAEDISAYTTGQWMVFQDPHGNESAKVASFDSDGSDGIVKYTVQSGDIDEAGFWKVRIKAQHGTSIIRSKWLGFEVYD